MWGYNKHLDAPTDTSHATPPTAVHTPSLQHTRPSADFQVVLMENYVICLERSKNEEIMQYSSVSFSLKAYCVRYLQAWFYMKGFYRRLSFIFLGDIQKFKVSAYKLPECEEVDALEIPRQPESAVLHLFAKCIAAHLPKIGTHSQLGAYADGRVSHLPSFPSPARGAAVRIHISPSSHAMSAAYAQGGGSVWRPLGRWTVGSAGGKVNEDEDEGRWLVDIDDWVFVCGTNIFSSAFFWHHRVQGTPPTKDSYREARRDIVSLRRAVPCCLLPNACWLSVEVLRQMGGRNYWWEGERDDDEGRWSMNSMVGHPSAA
ncbi:hypothetical protein BJ912DRAFT_931130 [Pholiota molesta]|nr:hypothetical protein BJ912DRAFT_931130 [Pholiota molesta]